MNKIVDISDYQKTIAMNLSVIGQQVSKYEEAIAKIENAFVTLNNLDIPTKSDFGDELPSWYEFMVKCRGEIENICQNFTLKLHNQLINYPQSVNNALDIIDNSIDNINSSIKVINENGKDEDVLKREMNFMIRYLSIIEDTASQQVESLGILVNNLNKYVNEYIPAINKDLENIIIGICQSNDDYKAKIDEYNRTIDSLQTHLNQSIAELVAACAFVVLGVADAVLTIGIAIVTGGITIPIVISAAIGLLGAITGLVGVGLTSYNIDQDRKAIQAAIDSINTINENMGYLTSWKKSVETCQKDMNGVLEGFQTVRNSWLIVKNGFRELGKQAQSVLDNFDINDEHSYEDLLAELAVITEITSKCEERSEAIREQIDGMKIEEHKFSKAKLELGMSAKEVEKAVNEAELLSFSEYMLAV